MSKPDPDTQRPPPADIKISLSGAELRAAFAAATGWLERNVQAINAINVFPVPDGDTGTNMFLTMRSTMEEAARLPDSASGGEVLAAMARGALMGARGNSGVILSQWLRGLSRVVDDRSAVDAGALARGLEDASIAAYGAVTRPVEGTILTVSREAAAAGLAALSEEASADTLLAAVARAASDAVAKTPSLLPVLAEAGVVDSGGQGLYVILQGLDAYVRGEDLTVAADLPAPGLELEEDWLKVTHELHEKEESLYGYCTEFLLGGSGLDIEAARKRMLELGDSVLVVGDEQLARVHLHTDDPGAALSYGTAAGSLLEVKVDNIHQQAERFLQQHEARPAYPQEPQAICLVAVAAGKGLAQVLRSVGVTAVVAGGPTMNPSASEICAAIEACPAEQVIILPNDKNIVLVARQAIELTRKRAFALPTRSVPQGIAAALAVNQEREIEANITAMEEAAAAVRTIEITRAVRSTSIGGVTVAAGEAIAILDDELTLAAETPEQALLGALAILSPAGALLTIYFGADTAAATANTLAGQLRLDHPDCEVEVVSGGQPHYHYIASLE